MELRSFPKVTELMSISLDTQTDVLKSLGYPARISWSELSFKCFICSLRSSSAVVTQPVPFWMGFLLCEEERWAPSVQALDARILRLPLAPQKM